MFEVISPTAVRRLKAERMGNLEALLWNAVSHLEEVGVKVTGGGVGTGYGRRTAESDIAFGVVTYFMLFVNTPNDLLWVCYRESAFAAKKSRGIFRKK